MENVVNLNTAEAMALRGDWWRLNICVPACLCIYPSFCLSSAYIYASYDTYLRLLIKCSWYKRQSRELLGWGAYKGKYGWKSKNKYTDHQVQTIRFVAIDGSQIWLRLLAAKSYKKQTALNGKKKERNRRMPVLSRTGFTDDKTQEEFLPRVFVKEYIVLWNILGNIPKMTFFGLLIWASQWHDARE